MTVEPMQLNFFRFKTDNQWRVYVLWLLFSLVLIVSSPLCFSQGALPSPARPRPGPPADKLQLPAAEIPKVDVLSLDGEAPAGAAGIFVILHAINFEGATVYSNDFLGEFYVDLIGKQISLAQIFVIAEQVEEKYRSDGYMLTRVIVPQQSVDDGVFKVQVIEGYIAEVEIVGDAPVKERIKGYLNHLLDVRPVKEQDLDRYLLLINDIPGMSAEGFLRSGIGTVGASTLVVRIARKPFEGYAYVNNRGSKFTGPYRFSTMIRENSATFLGEQIEGVFFNTLFTDEQRFGGLAYRQILNNEGLQLELSAGYGPSEPDLNSLDVGDVETESLTVNASLNYAVIRSRTRNVYVYGGFQAIDEKVKISGAETSRDRVRVLYVNGSYELIDDFGGQSVLDLGLRKGLNAFGASEEGDSNLEQGAPDFTSINIQVSRYQPLWDRLGLYLGGAGQFAFNTLLNSEQFYVGGETFGRGYNPSELAGDSGVGVSAEFQYTMNTPYNFWQSIQGYGFYDFGVVWNRVSDENIERSNSLASAGIGIRNRFLNRINIDLELAWPLTRSPDRFDKDPRFFFQVLTRF